MKTTRSPFRAVSGIILLLIIIIISNPACKKSDTNYIPIENNQSDVPQLKFGAMDIQTAYEKQHDLKLYSHHIGSHFAAVDGITSDMYGFKWKDLDPVYNISKAMSDYKSITSDINKVKVQIQEAHQEIDSVIGDLKKIEEEIKELAHEIQVDLAQMEAETRWFALEQELTIIEELYSTESMYDGLLYYFHMADSIANKMEHLNIITRRSKMADLHSKFKEFNNSTNRSRIVDAINQVQTILGKSASAQSVNLLSDILDVYILKNSNPSPATALNAYVFIEKLFMKAVHHQSTGLIVYGNFLNDGQSTPNDFFNYKKQTFNPIIAEEIQLLFNIAYRLVINSTTVSTAQFQSDMRYVNLGIAPDMDFFNLLARVSFVTSLLQNDGDNLNPFFGGVIYTPYYYFNGGNAPPSGNLNCLLEGNPFILKCDVQDPVVSQIPYTRWTLQDTVSKASPDNQWAFFQGIQESTDNASIPASVSVYIQSGDASAPWNHNPAGNIEITCTIKWWNPSDPDPATATDSKTSTNTMPFGFFACRWLWGYQALAQGTLQKNFTYTPASSPRMTKDYIYEPNAPANPGTLGIGYYQGITFSPGYQQPTLQNLMSITIHGQPYVQASTGPGYLGISEQFEQKVLFDNSLTSQTDPQNPPVTLYMIGQLERKSALVPIQQYRPGINDQFNCFYIVNTLKNEVMNLMRSKTVTAAQDTTFMSASVFVSLPSPSYTGDIYYFERYLSHIEYAGPLLKDLITPLPFYINASYFLQPIFLTKFDILKSAL